MKLFIMVGPPGSGKSYASKKLKLIYGAEYFSSDLYRVKVCGDINCQTSNQEVFNTLYNDLVFTLRQGKNCIFDATNCNRKSRKTIINMVKNIEGIEIIAYVLRTPKIICYERDSKRDRRVGDDVIDKFINMYEFPQRFEGFTDIILDGSYWNPQFTDYDNKWQCFKRVMDKWDQENPHHIYTLGKHCNELAKLTLPSNNVNLYTAGLLHDIGKLYTQQKDDQKIAHYYSHDNVGTYYILSELSDYKKFFPDQETLEYILFIVNYHMKGHKDWRSDKYRQLVGDQWYNDLIFFANCDMEGSGTESIHSELMEWIKSDKLTLNEIRNKPEYKDLILKNTNFVEI